MPVFFKNNINPPFSPVMNKPESNIHPGASIVAIHLTAIRGLASFLPGNNTDKIHFVVAVIL